MLPAGAIAGLDGLAALRRGGLSSVRYIATKPPQAWRGTPAEEVIDLDSLRTSTVVFQGSAAEAARLYPRNANLAATVALAGIGFEETVVELVADPTTDENAGRIEAEGALGRLQLELRGAPMSDNPKTSAITAYSILEAIEDRTRTLVV
jgi:aspartate dehydrogenase